MHTFCLPEGITGTIVVPTQPTGPGVNFKVKVTFNVPGGCGPLKYLDVQTVSDPTGITCKPAKVDYDCQATTSCKASKDGTFKLSAKLKGVSGIVTDPPVNVLVGGAQPDAGVTTKVTINVNFNDLGQQEVDKVTKAAQVMATALTAELKKEAPTAGVTVQFKQIKAVVEGVAQGAQVEVSATSLAPTVIIFTVSGNAARSEETLSALKKSWPELLGILVNELQIMDLVNLSGNPVGAGDVSAVILVDGAAVGGPIAPGDLPNPDNKVGVTVNAEAGLVILSDMIQDAQSAILATAWELLTTDFNALANAGTTIDSVTITPGATSTTRVEVKISCPVAIGRTVLATVSNADAQNIIIRAIKKLAQQSGFPQDFSITITAALEVFKVNTPRR